MTTNGNGNGRAQVLAAVNELLGRSRMVQKLAGKQYGGERDIYAVAGYPAQDKVTFAHYWGLYERDGIAGRIVDMMAQTTWRTPPKVVEQGMPPEGTEFTQAFDKLAKRLKLWSYCQRVD